MSEESYFDRDAMRWHYDVLYGVATTPRAFIVPGIVASTGPPTVEMEIAALRRELNSITPTTGRERYWVRRLRWTLRKLERS